jgi:hypothetical protein
MFKCADLYNDTFKAIKLKGGFSIHTNSGGVTVKFCKPAGESIKDFLNVGEPVFKISGINFELTNGKLSLQDDFDIVLSEENTQRFINWVNENV